MEEVVMYVINSLIQFADKHEWLSYTLMVIGGLYFFLSAIRGFLTVIVKVTKTEKDNKIVDTIFAFLDKYAYGFGALSEYFEKKVEQKKKSK